MLDASTDPLPLATVEAETTGGRLAFDVTVPPTAEELERWRLLASFIPEATWTATPGPMIRGTPAPSPPAQ